jgi:hypothetical protein
VTHRTATHGPGVETNATAISLKEMARSCNTRKSASGGNPF